MRETRIRWFGHIKRTSVDAPVRRCETINLPEYRTGRGQPKNSWIEAIKQDLNFFQLTDDMA